MARSQKTKAKRDGGNSVEISGALGAGTAKIKKKIRDIERLLRKDAGLPADVRVANERALKGLKVELQMTEMSLRARKMAKKYHMVRFFEKKKALRKLKQARKQLEEAKEGEVKKEIKKARKVVKHCEVDLVYIVMYPKTEKYISLYPNGREDEKAEKSGEKSGEKAGEKAGHADKAAKKVEEKRREYKRKAEKLLDENKLPFSIDDLVEGKTVKIDPRQNVTTAVEIDAPEQQSNGQDVDEDEFFE